MPPKALRRIPATPNLQDCFLASCGCVLTLVPRSHSQQSRLCDETTFTRHLCVWRCSDSHLTLVASHQSAWDYAAVLCSTKSVAAPLPGRLETSGHKCCCATCLENRQASYPPPMNICHSCYISRSWRNQFNVMWRVHMMLVVVHAITTVTISSLIKQALLQCGTSS